MKLKRTLGVVAGLIVTAVAVAALALVWVYATESGARFVLGKLESASGGALRFGGISGRFSDAIVLTDVSYRDAAQEASVDELELRLGLVSLADRMLVVEDLRSSVVHYRALSELPAAATGGAATFTLPLTLRVDRASIEGVSLERPDGSLELERIIVAGAAEGTTAYLQRFEIRALGFFISMQGGISWDQGLSIDGLVSWSGDIDGRSWLGSAKLSGRWPTLSIDEEMLAPFEQSASGTVTLGAAPAFDLAIEWPGLGSVRTAGGLDPDGMQWRASLAGNDLSPDAIVPGWPGRWSVDGNLALAIGEGFRLETDDLHLEGVLDARRLELDFAGAYDDTGSLEVRRLLAVLGENRVEASGSIASTLDLALTARLDDLAAIADLAAAAGIEGLNESAGLAATLTGRASADLALTGDLAAPRATGSLRLEDSSYAGLPLELAVEFASPTGSEEMLTIERLDGRLGATRLSGRGRLDPRIVAASGILAASGAPAASGTPAATDGPAAPGGWRNFDGSIELDLTGNAPDLGELATVLARDEVRALIGRELPLAGLSGSAEARVSVRGSPRRPDLDGELRLRGLDLDRLQLSEAALAIHAGLFDGGAANLTLDARAADWSARLAASGAIRDDQWAGTLASLDIEEPWLGQWGLESPVDLTLAPGRIDVGDACLKHLDSGICGEWHYGGDADKLRLSAQDFDLAVLNPLLPPTMSLEGPVALEATLDVPAGSPVGRLRAESSGIGISIATSETDRVTTRLTSMTLDAALDGFALDLEAAVASGDLGHADIALSTADIRDETAPIGGRVEVSWPDLTALSLLSPDVGEVGGTLSLGIELAGTAASPELSGSGRLTDGRIAVPEWGLLVDRIQGEAVSAEGRSVRYSGSGFVEDSQVFVSGVTELDPEASWPTHLTLTGDQVPVARRPDATVIASPDFDVDIRLPRIDVTGSVFVPEADLSVEQLPSQAVRVSPDSVVHGREAPTEAIRPLEVTGLVSVDLGDDVRYTGSGLNTALSGGLSIEYMSGRSPIAGGSLKLDGTYQAYGQTLNLERGELLFAGPLNDPAIDVLAAKSIGQTTVGVRVSGTLQSPVSTLYSNPAMSDLNVLSYLMFNRPAGSENAEDSNALEAAAFALGVQQALPVVQRVGETLGLDELSIEATEIDAGSLMAGKYLSPKLYLSYTYGLFNRLGGFLLRYDINDRFSLETRSGNEKAMDLLYSIEKE